MNSALGAVFLLKAEHIKEMSFWRKEKRAQNLVLR
jgi:hypothetical protein